MGGYWGEERLRNLYHFLKRPVPVYQLLVYPLIGQFFNVRKWNREVSCKRKSWTSLNFRVYAWPFIHCLYFIYARKFYTSTACKNYATVDIHLKTANANHACDSYFSCSLFRPTFCPLNVPVFVRSICPIFYPIYVNVRFLVRIFCPIFCLNYLNVRFFRPIFLSAFCPIQWCELLSFNVQLLSL